MPASVLTSPPLGHRTAHTVSRSEASVEERSWAGQDSRDVTRRCCAIYGAGRVRRVAACGVPARSGLPRHRLPPGRLPRVPSRPRRARARRARPRAAQGLCRRPSLRHGGGSRWSCSSLVSRAYALTQLLEAVFRPSHAESATGRWRQRAVSSWGCLLYSAFCLSTARLLVATPPRETAQSEQRQDIDVTATVLRTGWGRLLLILVGVLVMAAAVEMGRRSVWLDFRERFTAEHMSRPLAMITRAVGAYGCIARSVVLVLVGVFLIKAAVESNANQTKGLDAIFRSVASSAGGAWLLALLAFGLVCYGLYCLIEARYRDLTPGR